VAWSVSKQEPGDSRILLSPLGLLLVLRRICAVDDDMSESGDFSETSLSQQIKSDYNIVRLLGKGGMGEVYLAEQLRVGRRPVALKVLNRSYSENPDLRKRFENEAASAGRIRHRNVVLVYESRITEDGQLYVAMEYVEGADLGHLIEERGSLPLGEVVEITKQIAAGLGAAHKLGIVHRDIKPGNIMLTEDEDGALLVKVLDFGIARLSEPDSNSAQTKTGMVMGTPHYMSPEQTLGQTGDKIDLRSDIYSLAMVVHQMLTGRVAFEADSWVQVMYKHINEAPQPPSQIRPDLVGISPVDQVILKGLEKDRERRQQSAVDLAKELDAVYSGLRPGTSAAAPTTSGLTSPRPVSETATIVAPETRAQSAGTREIGPTNAPTGAEQDTVAIPGATASKDPQSFRTVAIAQPPTPAASSGESSQLSIAPAAAPVPGGSKSPAGKKLAAAASAIILLGLSAAAYFAMRGRSNPAERIASDASVVAPLVSTPATPSPQPSENGLAARATPSPTPKAEKTAAAASKNEAQKEPPQKESLAPSANAAEEAAKPARNPHDTGPSPKPSPATPVQPSPAPAVAKPTASPNANEGTCLGMTVTGADGSPVARAQVTIVDGSSGQRQAGVTGPVGGQRFCGLTVGSRVTITVYGPAGKRLLATQEVTLTPGRNHVKIETQFERRNQ
jgi:serine/threonine protein kinase